MNAWGAAWGASWGSSWGYNPNQQLAKSASRRMAGGMGKATLGRLLYHNEQIEALERQKAKVQKQLVQANKKIELAGTEIFSGLIEQEKSKIKQQTIETLQKLIAEMEMEIAIIDQEIKKKRRIIQVAALLAHPM